jgi:hypothetical protein
MFQGIFMLVSGYFRLPHDIPKPFWRYPMSYISFHYWALQVKKIYQKLPLSSKSHKIPVKFS